MTKSLVLCAAVALAAAAATPATAQRLGDPELQATMVGHPLTVISPHRGDIGQIVWKPDGTGSGEFRAPTGQVIRFTGRWAIRDGQWCRTLEGQSREACFTIVMVRDGTLEQRDHYGRVSLRYRVDKVVVPKGAPPEPPAKEEAPEEDVPQK